MLPKLNHCLAQFNSVYQASNKSGLKKVKNKKCLHCKIILSDLIYCKTSVFWHVRVANTATVREEWKHVLFFIE